MEVTASCYVVQPLTPYFDTSHGKKTDSANRRFRWEDHYAVQSTVALGSAVWRRSRTHKREVGGRTLGKCNMKDDLER